MARDTTLDQTFDCSYTDVHGNIEAGIAVITTSMHGEWGGFHVIADPITITLTQHGTYPSGFIVVASPMTITLSLGSPEIDITPPKQHWFKWSDIDNSDFTIWKDSVAGECPANWKGWVYAVKKLGNKWVGYGENGVTVFTPTEDVHFSMNTIYRIGLKGKNAIAGDDFIHFFIDNKGQLFSLGESLQKLDYSEYLSPMTSPVMSYDIENGLIYICDGTYGYVYSPADESMGEGPINVTGISSQGGTLYVASPDTITTPNYESWTDIHDMRTRKNKTVFELEYGTNLTIPLMAAIEYKRDFRGSFTRTPWYNVSESGSVFITAMGREFKFGAKTTAYEYFEFDYVTARGIIHAH